MLVSLNKDSKKLDKTSSKDIIFIDLIERCKKIISYVEIVYLLKNDNSGKLQFKEGSINANIKIWSSRRISFCS